jgi:hypothetical protein
MPGTLFLDALKRKTRLEKGYPMQDGRTLEPAAAENTFNPLMHGLPQDRDLYKGESLTKRLKSRLREAINGPAPNADYEGVRDRLDVEESEGLSRRDNDITSLGQKSHKKGSK